MLSLAIVKYTQVIFEIIKLSKTITAIDIVLEHKKLLSSITERSKGK